MSEYRLEAQDIHAEASEERFRGYDFGNPGRDHVVPAKLVRDGDRRKFANVPAPRPERFSLVQPSEHRRPQQDGNNKNHKNAGSAHYLVFNKHDQNRMLRRYQQHRFLVEAVRIEASSFVDRLAGDCGVFARKATAAAQSPKQRT